MTVKKTLGILRLVAAGLFILFPLGGCNKSFVTTPLSVSPSAVPTNAAAVYTAPQATNRLGSNLYNFYQGQSGNILFSPYSIITCLAMAQEGAVGSTQTQMQTVLGLDPDGPTRWSGFQQLISHINDPSKLYNLATADDLWPQQGFALEPAFVETLQTYYDAGVTAVDYVGNPTGAVETIDGAVSQETDGYIPQLLSNSDVNSSTKLVLTNAVYFQADWQSQFVTTGTTPQNFTMDSGATESVSMMHQNLGGVIGNYNGAASVLALPYQGDGASMYIFLPPPGAMADLESQMSGTNINSWLAANASAMTVTGLGSSSIALSLPKFTFSTNYHLASTLSAMGMPLAFTKPGTSGADFSGIDGQEDLYIAQVIHQAYINVDERGTTAAAATAVVVVSTAVAGPPITYIPFTVDHPFIFLIVDNATNTVLFMGRVEDPLSAS